MPNVVIQPPEGGKVIPFPTHRPAAVSAGDPGAPWRNLTRRLVLARAERGELPPAVLEALLDNAGVAP